MSKDETEMRILKKATCDTVSGKSKLTYQIGCNPESEIHIRIHGNTGGGFFSDEWISYDAVQDALKKRREGQAITSFLLDPLYVGRSSNNCSFLLAVLKHLKLVQPLPKKKREFEAMNPRPFLDQVNKLMASPEKAKAPTKKTVTKKTGGNAPTKKAFIKKAAIKKASAKKRTASRAKASTD